MAVERRSFEGQIEIPQLVSLPFKIFHPNTFLSPTSTIF